MPVRRQYGTLPQSFIEELRTITPSMDGPLKYYPCAVKLKNDQVLACVYIVRDEAYIHMWGVYPEDDRAKSWIRIEDVKALAESPRRLPARFAIEIYRAGESRMGGTVFTVVFSDGSRDATRPGMPSISSAILKGKDPQMSWR